MVTTDHERFLVPRIHFVLYHSPPLSFPPEFYPQRPSGQAVVIPSRCLLPILSRIEFIRYPAARRIQSNLPTRALTLSATEEDTEKNKTQCAYRML